VSSVRRRSHAVVICLLIGTSFDASGCGSDSKTSGSSTTSAAKSATAGGVTITGKSLPAMTGQDPATDPAVGKTIPTVVGKDLNGSTLTIKPGVPQVVMFVAHWCPHCQREVPMIVGWQASGQLPPTIKLIAVSTAVAAERGNYPPVSWLKKENWKNPTMADTAKLEVFDAFGATGFPTFVAVTATGKVAQRASGEVTLEQIQALFQAAQQG